MPARQVHTQLGAHSCGYMVECTVKGNCVCTQTGIYRSVTLVHLSKCIKKAAVCVHEQRCCSVCVLQSFHLDV